MGSNADRFKMTQGKNSVRIRSAVLLARFTIARARQNRKSAQGMSCYMNVFISFPLNGF